MTIKHIFITSLLTIALSAPAMAEESATTNKVDTSELSAPLIELMPAFKKVRKELMLDEEQAKAIDAWMNAAPAKKQELKENIVAVRAELRDALITRATRIKREELKFNLSEANRRLIELQSLCARMLHKTLTKEQYAKVVDTYKQSGKS